MRAVSVGGDVPPMCRRYGSVQFAEGMGQPAGADLVRVMLSRIEPSELLDVAGRRGRWWSLEDPPPARFAAPSTRPRPPCSTSSAPATPRTMKISPITLTAGGTP